MRSHVALALVALVVARGAWAQPAARPSDTQKLEAAADNLTRMKTSLKQVLGRAEQARNEKDVVKLNCINEKLTQIRALIKVAEQADLALHESIATRDAGGDAESSKIAIARTKVDGLRTGSEQCVGQLAYMVDDKTTVEMEQPSAFSGRASGLGVATRGQNPADVGGDLGGDGDGAGDRGSGGGRGGPPFVPPPIVRPPPASPYR